MSTCFHTGNKNHFLGILFVASLVSFQTNAQQFTSFVKQFISVNADTLALIHAKIVDGTGNASKNDQTIIIIKGRIAKAGNSATTTISPSAKVIDCSGKTIIPGMVMMHEHLFYGESLPPNYLGLEMPISFPRLYFAGGAARNLKLILI
jgi:imidazolonepropionase-like amidohydrolase